MALIENGRKLMRKRVRFGDWSGDPDDPDYVDVPVIVELAYRDTKSNNQDYVARINNAEHEGRLVVSFRVFAATGAPGSATLSESDYIDAERIQQYGVKDPKSNNQESQPRLRADDPPPTTPDGDAGEEKRHRKTHLVRYTKDNTKDGLPAVDFELIDETETRDPKDHQQESVLILKHPDTGDLEIIDDPSDPYAQLPDNPLYFEECDPELDLLDTTGATICDPPWRFDPWRNPVNVIRDQYRLVAILVHQNGTVIWTISFTTPKVFISEAEINAAEINDTLIQAPVFGELIDTPTDTRPVNDNPEFPGVGDELKTHPPTVDIDYHGYTDVTTWLWSDDDPDLTEPTGPHLKYDYKTQTVTDIPILSVKGRTVASDENGAVFVRLHPPDPLPSGVNRGFTKYDADGNVLWNLDNEAETFKIIPADDINPTRIKMFYLGTYALDVYDLNGSFIDGSDVHFPDEFSVQDVSRKGKFYGFVTSTTDGVNDDISCYADDATTLLWTIPGEDVSTGYQFVQLTAYGEDYLTALAWQNFNDGPGENFGVHVQLRVYNAHDGTLVSIVDLPDNTFLQSIEHVDLFDRPSYDGAGMQVSRSVYWP